MAQGDTKVPVKTAKSQIVPGPQGWWPLESLRRDIDRLFEDFGRWRPPLHRPLFDFEALKPANMVWENSPAVDLHETDQAFELSAELPGLDEKNVEVSVADGGLTIKGEKKEEKEEKKKDYYLSERRYGSFQRYFAIPDTVNVEQIEAHFKNGVLKVTLPKSAEARKPEKKIEVKAA